MAEARLTWRALGVVIGAGLGYPKALMWATTAFSMSRVKALGWGLQAWVPRSVGSKHGPQTWAPSMGPKRALKAAPT